MVSLEILLIIIFSSLLIIAGIAYFLQKYKEKKELKNHIWDELFIVEELKNISKFNNIEIFLGEDINPFGFYIFELATTARKNISQEWGVIVPEIKIKIDYNLRPTEYLIKIQEQEQGKGFVILDQYLATSEGPCNDLDGIRVLEPINNHCAIWIDETLIEKAENLGYTIIKDFEIISVHLLSILKQDIYKFINRDYAHNALENLKITNPILVEETKNKLSNNDIKNILIELLKNDIPIRNMEIILEISLDNVDQQNLIISEIEKRIK